MAPSVLTTIKTPGKLTARSTGIRGKLPNAPVPTFSPPVLPRPQTIPTTTKVHSTKITIISGLSSIKIDTIPITTNFPSTSTFFSKSTSLPNSLPPLVITSSDSSQTITEAFDITGGATGGVSSTILSFSLPTLPSSSERLPTATSTGRPINGLSTKRILPIAIIVPIVLISTILLALYILRRRRRMRETLLPHMTSQSRKDFDDWNHHDSSGEFHSITPFDVFKNAGNINGAATTNFAKTKRPVATPISNAHSNGLSIHRKINRRPSPLASKKVRQRLPSLNMQETPPEIPNDGIATQGHNTPNVIPEDHSGQRHAPTFSPTRIMTFLMEQVDALQERLQFMEDTAHAIGRDEQNTRGGNHGSLEGELIPPPRYTSTISVTVS